MNEQNLRSRVAADLTRLAAQHQPPWNDATSERTEPMDETMTVTVRDRSADTPWGTGLTQPVTRQITISAYCQQPGCGQRRGEPQGLNSCDDGAHYWVQTWRNPCGHSDMYADVIKEAKARDGLGSARTN